MCKFANKQFQNASEVLANNNNNTKNNNQARSQGGSGGSADPPPLENQRSTFWNLAREIIKATNYKWLTIYLHQLLCTKPPTKWLQNLLSKGGSGGANL